MRKLNEVIDQILEVAPELEDNFRSLKASVMYSAPENMGAWWDMAAEILNENTVDHPKLNEIVDIFAGRLHPEQLICSECGEPMYYTGVAYYTSPLQYEHKCENDHSQKSLKEYSN